MPMRLFALVLVALSFSVPAFAPGVPGGAALRPVPGGAVVLTPLGGAVVRSPLGGGAFLASLGGAAVRVPLEPSGLGGVAFRWPVDPPVTVTRRFEPPPGPYQAGHRGADLLGVAGAEVRSAGPGVVAFAGMVAGRPVVSVSHPGGLRTTYEPVDPSVRVGTVVSAGTPLGVLRAGHAGCPAAACLHWGLRSAETYLDPLSLLRRGRVRLLPP